MSGSWLHACGATIWYLYHVHVCVSVPPIKHLLFYSFQYNIYNLQCFYEIFHIFKKKWITYSFSTAGPGWFSWKFSLLSGRYTDTSITNCNTVYTTSCRLTSTRFFRYITTTEIHFHAFSQSTCLFRTFSVIVS